MVNNSFPRTRNLRRRAFTLIELMTVIAITLILIGLFFAGMKHWNANAARVTTVERMQVLSAMLGELEAQGHNSFASQWFSQPTVPPAFNFPPNDVPGNAYAYSSVVQDSVAGTADMMTVPGGSPIQIGVSNRAAAIDDTSQSIMSQLVVLPDNSKNLAKLPSSAVAAFAATTVAPATPLPPVLLDGWGNPIIFVPASGLGNVYVNVGTSNPTKTIIQSPDGRPFWASAGPDGDFARGDDNIYSFQGQ